jgi:hypothetical protein
VPEDLPPAAPSGPRFPVLPGRRCLLAGHTRGELRQAQDSSRSSLRPAQNAGDAIAWGSGFMLVAVLLGIISVVIWIWALVDAIQNPALDGTLRLVWVLVIVFTGIIGAAIYLLIGRSLRATSVPP